MDAWIVWRRDVKVVRLKRPAGGALDCWHEEGSTVVFGGSSSKREKFGNSSPVAGFHAVADDRLQWLRMRTEVISGSSTR